MGVSLALSGLHMPLQVASPGVEIQYNTIERRGLSEIHPKCSRGQKVAHWVIFVPGRTAENIS